MGVKCYYSFSTIDYEIPSLFKQDSDSVLSLGNKQAVRQDSPTLPREARISLTYFVWNFHH